jgi:hypothetical protein
MNNALISPNFQKSGKRNLFVDFFVFLCPVLVVIEINLIGRLFLSEVLLAIILPLLILQRGRLLLEPLPRTVIILGLVWLAGQIFTDLVRETPFQDWSRGWAKITFLILNFSSIYLLINQDARRIVLFFLGSAMGSSLDYFVSPTILMLTDPWKFGAGALFSALLILFVQWRVIARFPILPVLMISALGLFSIYMGSRGSGGLLILSAIYLYVHSKPELQHWLKRFSIGRMVTLVVITSFSIWGILATYSIAASSGWLGEAAKKKYHKQSGKYGILLGGRAEILVSSQAIKDSPIIGHGSWAKDIEYRKLYLELKKQLGYYVGDFQYLLQKSKLIPSHSHLFGAWVEAGILGALFWVWVFYLVFRSLFGLFRVEHYLLPLFVIKAIGAAWTILFSPFGAEGRLSWGFILTILIVIAQLSQRSKTVTNHKIIFILEMPKKLVSH